MAQREILVTAGSSAFRAMSHSRPVQCAEPENGMPDILTTRGRGRTVASVSAVIGRLPSRLGTCRPCASATARELPGASWPTPWPLASDGLGEADGLAG